MLPIYRQLPWDSRLASMLGSRQVTATYSAKDLGRAAAFVEVDGWGVKPKLVKSE